MVTKKQFLNAPEIYKETVLNEFNMTFPENELKFNKIEPVQNVFDFEYPDSVVNWAIANGKTTRGHTLV